MLLQLGRNGAHATRDSLLVELDARDRIGCAAAQSQAMKCSAARRVMRPKSSLYSTNCSAIAAAIAAADGAVAPCTRCGRETGAGSATVGDDHGATSGHLAFRIGRRRRRELLFLGAAAQCARRTLPGGDRGLHGIEIAGADERLMLRCAVAGFLGIELALLQRE
jgi:hypothetical protein